MNKKPACGVNLTKETTTKEYMKLLILQIGMGLLFMLVVAWITPEECHPMARFITFIWAYCVGWAAGIWLTKT